MEEALRCAYVPKNEKGIKDCDYMQFDSEDIEEYIISDNEFSELYSNGIFDMINDKADLMIEDYEEETISGRKIDSALEVIEQIDSSHDYSLKKALLAAKKYNTRVDLYF